MFSDLLQMSASANALLFGVFPVIIIALGVAYAIKQRRDRRKHDD